MTRQQIVDIMRDKFHYYKYQLTSIRSISDCAKKEGYTLIKNGVDNYDLIENHAIRDFTKPLKICRDGEDNKMKVYKGVPLVDIIEEYFGGGSFSPMIWCYLANKEDGDYIHFRDFADGEELEEEDVMSIAISFDLMSFLGYIEEKEDCIVFYLSKTRSVHERYVWHNDQEKKRYAPIRYLP